MDILQTIFTTLIPFIIIIALAYPIWKFVSILLTIKNNSSKKVEQNEKIINLLESKNI
ncbi:hypothetical protein H8R29_29785 (plasmid) [Priestia megaterium]|uniref:Uncharacterized protein n=1 Tax=Priestia megaterium (strain ATCC 14581 / DSM 32 / CCUG 1817 / JCM 2506 / NBRC 15308 / NCIMB 9376 / NCTC 10342 / NRRL B-14308 / VKM B-512 / Ford 19) TaxID=1348623 RepID=A0A0B6AJV2_PRIM2|nr:MULTISPECIES: hypothetical protein [Priestia]AJI20084.1 hypothetical protein BG04_6021 [Priestia megaterium NBRC 15308 = ATCC 14581]MBY0078517.1 hypothetical protein [Priestia aryabhattai]MED3808672.1 hypothetical protein [Priestia megaterium]MED4023946.1 hypothetical protein [Priestia aryabhattai]MED4399035.1 hypothetical protein [Priestia megaterium]